jgi:hypothetical protein
MASWQSGDVETNGIRLHYTRTGGLAPPLVLAHGVTDSGLCWTPIAEALAADYDVIMVDARPRAIRCPGAGLRLSDAGCRSRRRHRGAGSTQTDHPGAFHGRGDDARAGGDVP